MALVADVVVTEGQKRLQAWVDEQGGLRQAAAAISAAGRKLDFGQLGKWQRGDGAPGRSWREALAVVGPAIPVEAWDRVAPPAAAEGSPARRDDAPAPTPPSPTSGPAVAAQRSGVPPSPAARPPRTVAELQTRLREIPGEIAQLGEDVAMGTVVLTAAEPIRRIKEGEARALKVAIEASGVATVQEVEQLRQLLRDATQGCEGCRSKVKDGLRRIAGNEA